MKIILDQVQPDGERYVAYLQLVDGDKVIATKVMPYQLGDADTAEKIRQKFSSDIAAWEAKQAGLDQAKREIEAALLAVEKEAKK